MESLFTGDVFYSAPLRQKKEQEDATFPKGQQRTVSTHCFFFFVLTMDQIMFFVFCFFLRFCLRWHTSLTFSQSYPQFTALTANETKQSRESKVLKPNIKHRKKMKRGQARSHKGTKQGHRREKKERKKKWRVKWKHQLYSLGTNEQMKHWGVRRKGSRKQTTTGSGK